MYRALSRKDSTIGRTLETSGLKVVRTLLAISRLAPKDGGRGDISRTYLISIDTVPAMAIHERYPIAMYESALNHR